MPTNSSYSLTLRWTGNLGRGTADYRAYGRDHELSAPGKQVLLGSSDPAFRGDETRWSPEELLVAALSQCHLLWYLHLASTAGVVVTEYLDEPVGTLTHSADGGGQFSEVVLKPLVTVAEASMLERAQSVHPEAARLCFIARSMNFPVRHQPRSRLAGDS
ncbi:MAG TPA: OsmC family protein [Jatrophihabitans sp.]|nr:OsmC family protein [Jatrophihabitans sp.]